MTTCKNQTCECEAAEGSEYCSPYCANVDQSETIPGYTNARGGCACGHDNCHVSVQSEPAQSKIAVGPGPGES